MGVRPKELTPGYFFPDFLLGVGMEGVPLAVRLGGRKQVEQWTLSPGRTPEPLLIPHVILTYNACNF